MAVFPSVQVKQRLARPFFGRHPWVFTGAIEKQDPEIADGAQVRLVSSEKKFIAYGLYNSRSQIRVRLYSWREDQPIDEAMVVTRLDRAIAVRETLGLMDPKGGCRLAFSESDGLSGLIVDRFADVLSLQLTSAALAQFEPLIVDHLERRLQPRAIYRRTEKGIGELEGLEVEDALLAGAAVEEPVLMDEVGLILAVDPAAGQKTGAYLDQRENRQALCRYTQGRSVLDVFCYSGGFGIRALRFGSARRVVGIDVSGPALALAQRNADLNDCTVEFRQGQALAEMRNLFSDGERFGVVILDPPKFARSAGAVESATRGYEQLQRQAIELLEPGGILLSCSCSGHISPAQFLETLVSAAQVSHRDVRILEQRTQPPDHPISAFCLETQYLKCLIAMVD